MPRIPLLLLLIGWTMTTTLAHAAPSAAENRNFFQDLAETRSFTLGSPINAVPTPDGTAVLFLQSESRNPVQRLMSLDVKTGTVSELLTPEALLKGSEEQLTPEERARRERMRMSLRGFTSFQLSRDGARLLLSLSGKLYVVERANQQVTLLPGEGWVDPRFSPDGKRIAALADGALHVLDIAARESRRVSPPATDTLTYGSAEFVAQEEMGRFAGYWWSPDSGSLLFQETDQKQVELLYIHNPAMPEQPPESHRYPRAGTPNAVVRLGLVPLQGVQEPQWLSWDREKYPYLARVSWSEKSPLTILVQNRAQQEQQLLAWNTGTQQFQSLLTETDPAWLNLDDSHFPHWLEDGSGFLWSHEREEGWEVQLRNPDGSLKRVMVPASAGFRSLIHLDMRNKQLYYSGSIDPTQSQLFRVSLSGGKPEQLSKAPGFHQAKFAYRGQHYIHSFSLLDGTNGVELCDLKGKTLHRLPNKAEQPPFMPKLELTRLTGARTYDVAIVRPRDFDPGKKYPVILSVYAGPGHKTVLALPRMFLKQQWMADQGYIVVGLDGRGTPGHGRAWERAIRGNLIDVPLSDQVDGLKAAAAKYPELDLERVAVTGWSFGGYFTLMAVLRHPELFKVGMSGAPVTDFQDYDTHYTERYLGLPAEQPEAYRVSNVLTYTSQLERPLLVVHGLTDDNVYFLHSLKLSNAFFQHGKRFELLPMPGTHMLYDPGQTLKLWTRTLNLFNQSFGLPLLAE